MIWILWRLNKKKKTHSKIFQILYFFKLQFHEFSTNTQNLNNDKVLRIIKTTDFSSDDFKLKKKQTKNLCFFMSFLVMDT